MEKKIKLDTISDLSRLSFLEIKNLPLNKCQGQLFEDALKQAIQLEKQSAVQTGPYSQFLNKHHPKSFEIKKVVFQTQYEVEFGSEMSLVGSIQPLGKWNTINSSQPISLESLNNEDFFEYKFVETDEHGHVKKWQGGNNISFDLNKLNLIIKELNIITQIDHTGSTPFFTIDRRTKIKLESTNSKQKSADIIVIMSKFE
ncbi:starch binding domain-containing protein [Stylonychia lemnae]|uniref:Starch binding domain-containing protein n=1 Tax=Stylonychia lemnae TaxID=5949 RepID=A0A077ZQ90_STYLE|nr:starch binding domain-containing protein [Stylonychia lemnae]|eukprot:CDW72078.1 starch binding domain-containing protein [Stylonychia lemnae]